MAGKGQGSILIVDADTDAAQKIGLAIDSAGFEVAWTTFSPAEVLALLRELKPNLLLVHGEIGSAQVSTLLARLESASTAEVPVVLLCKDMSDEVFVRSMKTGIVDMLQEPFSPRLHIGRLRMVLAELPQRTGQLRGRGLTNEIQALVQHLVRTRRTGGLLVGEQKQGSAFYARGVLKSARYQALSLHAALSALSRAQLPWEFTEGAEGNAGVIELDSPEPYAVTYHGQGPAKRMEPQQSGSEMDLMSGLEDSVGPPPESAAPASPPPQQNPAPAVSAPSEKKPASAGVADATAAAAPDPAAADTPILFVDDEPAVVTMMATYFRRKGYPVATARDGVEALEQLVAHHFEVVIADLNMPRLDGWGLLRFLREDFRTREIPMALYSAHDDYRESLRLLHAGAQAFFPKTLRLSVLEAQVRELAEPRRRFLRLVDAQASLTFDFGTLGPQWVLRALAARKYSGQLDARDSWAVWRIWFEEGRLVQVISTVGGTVLTGDGALCSFLSSEQVEGTLSPGTRATEEGFRGEPTVAVLARNVQKLNDEHGRAREDQLARAKALLVDDELYRLYTTVGPPAWLPIARLLCEQKLTPAEVISRMQVSPMEVAAVVKDMLRRGVVGLQA